MQNIAKKIIRELESFYKYGVFEYFEIKRISNINRYKLFSTKILKNRIYANDSRSFIGQYNEIFKRKIYNFKPLDNQPYIIDCGANIGLSTIYFKLKFPSSEVIAFEPDPLVFKLLQKNIKSFKFNNVKLVNKGVFNKNGEEKFFGKGDDSGRIISNEVLPKNYRKIKVVSLRNYLRKKVCLLKIDIEGAEYKVIKDINDFLFNVSRIFIEYHSRINRIQELDKILCILKNNGFRFYVENTTIKRVNPFINISKNQDFDNLLNIYGYRAYE